MRRLRRVGAEDGNRILKAAVFLLSTVQKSSIHAALQFLDFLNYIIFKENKQQINNRFCEIQA